MMCIAALAVATVTWALVGYSLAFDEGNGDHRRPRPRVPARRRLRAARRARRSRTCCSWPSRRRFCIITVALVSGAVVERMRFGAFLVFAALWSVLVYAVLAHWAFGGGWLQEGGTLDFAGGVPVEMGSGFSALAAALVVGARKDYGRQALLPHNAVYVLLGAGPAVVRLVRLQRRQRLLDRQRRRARVHEHAAAPGLHARRLVRARPASAAGRSRRSARRRRSSSAASGSRPAARLHQPGVGDGCSARSPRCRATR